MAWRRALLTVQGITPRILLRTLLWITLILFGVWVSIDSWPALLPFVVGLMVAYILLPVVDAVAMALPVPRPAVSLLVVLLFFALLILLLVVLLAPLVEQTSLLLRNLPSEAESQQIIQSLGGHLSALPAPVRQVIRDTIQSIYDNIQSDAQTNIQRLFLLGVGSVLGLFRSLSFVLGLFAVPVVLLSALNRHKQIMAALDRLLPVWMRADVWAVVRIFNRSLRAFVQVQGLKLVAVSIGMYLAILLGQRLGWIDIRYPVVTALFAGLMQLIPSFGILLGALPAVITAFTVSPQAGLLVLLAYLLVLWLVELLFGRRFQRQVLDIHGAALILILVVLSAFGPLWLLLSAPIAAIIRDLFRYAQGRLGEPALPAGLLPGETLSAPPESAAPRRARMPLAYRRHTRSDARTRRSL